MYIFKDLELPMFTNENLIAIEKEYFILEDKTAIFNL